MANYGSKGGAMTQHAVTCKVQLGGDPGMIVVRGPTRPVPYPEIDLLRRLHGETCVFDVEVLGLIPRQAGSQEKARMQSIYGVEVVEAAYPGKSPRIDWYVEGEEPDLARLEDGETLVERRGAQLQPKNGPKAKNEPAREQEAI